MMKIIPWASAALVATVLFGSSGAWAFTIETPNSGNSNGSARFVDPDEQAPIQRFGGPSSGTQGYSSSVPGLNVFVTRPQDSRSGSQFIFDPSRNPRNADFGLAPDPSRPTH